MCSEMIIGGIFGLVPESGLNCYDRDHLKQYLHRPGDERTLPSNNITFYRRGLFMQSMGSYDERHLPLRQRE